MKKFIYLLALLVSTAVFTSCLDILEEVHYKKDGSGTYKMVVDMSKSKDMIQMMMGMDLGEEGEKMNLDSLFDTGLNWAKAIREIKGISNVKDITDKENYIVGIQYEFDNMKALNTAVMANNETQNKAITFGGEKKLFERFDNLGLTDELNSLGEAEEGDGEAEMAMMLFKDACMTMVYTFDRKVKKVSNPLSVISDKKRKVTTKYYMFDKEKRGEHGIKNTIKLR